MSTADEPRQTSMLDELRALVAKSIEANIKMVQNGSDLLRQAANREIDLSRLTERGRALVRQAFSDYVRLNTAHTSRLIDLNLAVSNGLLGAARRSASGAGGALFDMTLRGRRGSLCESAFAVESDRPAAVSATFAHSLFVDARAETAIDIPVHFDPAVLDLKPGERRRVIVSLTVPADAQPGPYQTLVTSEALPGMTFRLILEVEADEEGAPAPAKPAPAASRKRGGSRAANRRTQKKK